MYIRTIRRFVFLIFILCKFSVLHAQDSLSYALSAIAAAAKRPGIKIGETVPDIRIGKIVNHTSENIRLSDLQGKFVILDFWHQFCTVCIKEFPKLTNLQQQFGDSLLILPVTFQSKTSVIDFLKNRAAINKNISLPTVTEDTILHQLFPHAGDPHEIWIDKNGRVSAITNHLAVTAENISTWLIKGRISLPVKNDLMDFDPEKPLLVYNNGGPDTAFVFRSLFTKYLEGVHGGGYMAGKTETATRILIQNQTMESMYKICYTGLDNGPFKDMSDIMMGKRIIFETKDSSRNALWVTAYNAGNEKYLDFSRNYIFSFDLILPLNISLAKAYQVAIHDMDAFFGIGSTIERRKIKCLALTKIEGNQPIPASGSKENYSIEEENETMFFTNKSISFIVDKINNNCDMPIVIDETGCNLNIDLVLQYKNSDLDLLNKSLQEYGLSLHEKEYLLEVLVLKDSELKK